MKGYKAFHNDLTCLDMQYEVGKEFVCKGELKLCHNGFHFCERCADVFNYYPFDSRLTRVCEVEALGDIVKGEDKHCTNRLLIVRELSWDDVLSACNTGSGNTGLRNSGDMNSGYMNSGYMNSGDRNSGYMNSGDMNSGDMNSGNRNSGYMNKTNFSAGVLCTKEPECLIFDKPSGMTLREWYQTGAFHLLERVPFEVNAWIWEDNMTTEEKEAHPEAEILGGYLKKGACRHDFKAWWGELSDEQKRIIFDIPNFDLAKWKYITGLDVSEDYGRLNGNH